MNRDEAQKEIMAGNRVESGTDESYAITDVGMEMSMGQALDTIVIAALMDDVSDKYLANLVRVLTRSSMETILDEIEESFK